MNGRCLDDPRLASLAIGAEIREPRRQKGFSCSTALFNPQLGRQTGQERTGKKQGKSMDEITDAIVPDDMSFCRACSVEAIRANVSEGPG